MVGRDHELHRLMRLVASARPEVAFVAGEPGIGKTRLISEFLAALPAGTVVLRGEAQPGSLGRPYELFLDAVDSTRGGTATVDPATLAVLTDPARGSAERQRAALSIVDQLVDGAASVIVYEDLHWADAESTALFEHLADQSGRRLLVGAYRPAEVTRRQPVDALLARLERRHSVTHLTLGRLDTDETSALLAAATGRTPSYRTAMALHQRTGGNPFYLEELLRAHDADDLEQIVEQPLPWSLAEVLRQQIAGLDEHGRRIAEAAAVLGQRIPFDLLAAVTGASEAELIDTLRELVRRGVLSESGEDEFSFRHALVREAVTASLLGRQRRRLHEAALDVLLAGSGADPALIAYHARGARRYDDMVTAARAGSAAYLEMGSVYQALQLAERGLEQAAQDTALLATAARAAWLAGLLDDAIGYARRWRDRAGDDAEEVRALILLVRLAWEAGDVVGTDTLTSEIEMLVDQLPTGEEQGQAVATVAQSYMLREQSDKAMAWAGRALELAERHDLPRTRLAALVELGSLLVGSADRSDEGRDLLAGVAGEAEKAGDWVLAARAVHNLAFTTPPSSPHEQARLLERMRADAEQGGFDQLAVAAYYQGRAVVAVGEGDLAAAREALEEGTARGHRFTTHGRQADYHAVYLAGLALEAGDLDRARTVVAELIGLPRPRTVPVAGLVFHLACRSTPPGPALEALDGLLGALAADPNSATGDLAHDLVAAAVAGALPLPRIQDLGAAVLRPRTAPGWAALVRAQLARAAGRDAVALVDYRQAAGDVDLPPSARGTAHAGAAGCLLALGRPEPARAHLVEAGRLLARWSGWRVEQLAGLRERAGLPADGQAVTGPAALTPREREVALLVADGLTNAELARRLYISPRTAAVHVSSILRKLAVGSRTEVAAVLRPH